MGDTPAARLYAVLHDEAPNEAWEGEMKELARAALAEAAQGAAPHPRTYSLVGGGLDMFLVTDDESGLNIGYARRVGGPITVPIRGAAPRAEGLCQQCRTSRTHPVHVDPSMHPEEYHAFEGAAPRAEGRCETWGYYTGRQCSETEGHDGRHITEPAVGRYSAELDTETESEDAS